MEFNKIQFPDTWNKYSLDDVCSKITSGGTPSRTKPEFYENGSINWVKTKELNNYYIYDTEEKITEEALKKSSAKLLPTNTILLAMYGATVGELGILSKEMACNQACCALITNPKICDYRYLFYLLAFHKEEIINLATGAAQQNISAKIIRELTFRFPDIDQQKEIVDVLNTLDKKIQLNTQINQTLEQIAQTIFKSWFIDFDPVHAKANALASGQTAEQATQAAMAVISGKNTQELHRLQTANPEQYQQLREIAEAFPSGVDEEGVPRGWEERYLKDVCNIVYGKNLPTSELKEQGYPVFGGNGVIGFYDKYLYENPHTLVSCRGAASGKVIYSLPNSFVTNNSLVIEHSKSYLSSFYVYEALSIQNLTELTSGSAQPQMTIANMNPVQIIVPTEIVHSLYVDFVKDIYDKKLCRLYENEILSKIRDELLPKLLSGEV
ncbi:restriction endonuclease subunit S [uncultured Actinobacillus sp.]|uniref:restriction endonuclease subunit S n=1 Tax=uncultured Actinobacillus sp. TaxID=417616 RepID=UPI0025ECEFDF|nr:restriction endonuclease subunit S [uncultured Actinobacillus sp.]